MSSEWEATAETGYPLNVANATMKVVTSALNIVYLVAHPKNDNGARVSISYALFNEKNMKSAEGNYK